MGKETKAPAVTVREVLEMSEYQDDYLGCDYSISEAVEREKEKSVERLKTKAQSNDEWDFLEWG